MLHSADHSYEVEQRITAILIHPCDCCSFFVRRESAQAGLKECWYCDYADFDKSNPDIRQQGFCKFTNRR